MKYPGPEAMKYPMHKYDPPVTYYWGPEIDRQTARDLGRERYFTNRPCKWGHIAERQVSCAHCIECDKHRKRTKEFRDHINPRWRARYHTDKEWGDQIRTWQREYYRQKHGIRTA